MKTLKSILVLAVLIILSGCKNDDDSGSSLELNIDNLSGSYNLVFLESEEVETQIINGATIESTIDVVADSFTNSVLTFNTDGTYTLNYSYRVIETITVTGNDPQEEIYIETETDSGTFILNEDDETITIDGDVITISRFNDNQLRLTFSDTDVDDDITTTYSLELRFTR